MATPAEKLSQLREQLFDVSVRKHELWLHRVRREIDAAHARGEVADAEYHDVVGVVYGLLGDKEAALANFDRAIVLDPGNLVTRYNRALALLDVDRLDEAIEELEQVRADGGARPDVGTMATLAGAYASVGEWPRARRTFAEAVERADLDDVDHCWRLALSAAEVGRYQRAVELFARFLARRAGRPLDDVLADPLRFILRARNEWLKDVPDIPGPIEDAIHRAAVRRGIGVSSPTPPEEHDDSEALDVFDAFEEARRAATDSVTGNDEPS